MSSDQVFPNALAMIGNTPLVEVQRLDTGPCRLLLKLENQNPGGSIKDRIGLSMIEAAEQAGLIQPGDTLIEGTAGNTGIGLALAAAQKGYRLKLVIPDKMSREKIFNLKAMGAEIVLTRSDVAKGHPAYYQDLAQTMAEQTPGAYFINQFGNAANPQAHYDTTGPEILAQTDGAVDAVICGCGSSGTVTGLSRFFAQAKPDVDIVLADPEGSILADYINHGELSDKNKSWLVEGIGEDFLPDISDFSQVKQAFSISDAESFRFGRELLLKEGIFGGSSTGTNIAAALAYCQAQQSPKTVVTFVCDTGNKYLSKMYNDYWMLEQGFIERPTFGDLRDLITRPYTEHDTIVVAPNEPLNAAYVRMKSYDISQLPVMQDERLVGILDEEDILLAVHLRGVTMNDPVERAMITNLDTIQVDQSIDDLIPLFDDGRVAIVMQGDTFLGLITRMDVISYLRRDLGNT